jgi:hypothetical protein
VKKKSLLGLIKITFLKIIKNLDFKYYFFSMLLFVISLLMISKKIPINNIG